MNNNRMNIRTIIGLNFLFGLYLLAHLYNSPSSTTTSAYLDPGTGSMIISAIVGIAATIALGVKTFWYKIVRLFKPSQKAPSRHHGKKK